MRLTKRLQWLVVCVIAFIGLIAGMQFMLTGSQDHVTAMKEEAESLRADNLRPPKSPPRTVVTDTKSHDGTSQLKTVYRNDKAGRPLACDFYDAEGTRLFRCRFGYDPRKGPTRLSLVEIQMFDARVKRDDNSGEETPVRRFLYTYDPSGKRSPPLVVTPVQSDIAENFFGSTEAGFDPFEDHLP